jgi:hypothetical protein
MKKYLAIASVFIISSLVLLGPVWADNHPGPQPQSDRSLDVGRGNPGAVGEQPGGGGAGGGAATSISLQGPRQPSTGRPITGGPSASTIGSARVPTSPGSSNPTRYSGPTALSQLHGELRSNPNSVSRGNFAQAQSRSSQYRGTPTAIQRQLSRAATYGSETEQALRSIVEARQRGAGVAEVGFLVNGRDTVSIQRSASGTQISINGNPVTSAQLAAFAAGFNNNTSVSVIRLTMTDGTTLGQGSDGQPLSYRTWASEMLAFANPAPSGRSVAIARSNPVGFVTSSPGLHQGQARTSPSGQGARPSGPGGFQPGRYDIAITRQPGIGPQIQRNMNASFRPFTMTEGFRQASQHPGSWQRITITENGTSRTAQVRFINSNSVEAVFHTRHSGSTSLSLVHTYVRRGQEWSIAGSSFRLSGPRLSS